MMGVIFLIVMVVIAAFAYRYYSSPAYTLTRIARAVEGHDQRTFDKYVDRETLSANLADDLVNFTSSMIEQKHQKEGGEDNSAKANMARMMAEAMKPRMVVEIDQAIVQLVRAAGYHKTDGRQAEIEKESRQYPQPAQCRE